MAAGAALLARLLAPIPTEVRAAPRVAASQPGVPVLRGFHVAWRATPHRVSVLEARAGPADYRVEAAGGSFAWLDRARGEVRWDVAYHRDLEASVGSVWLDLPGGTGEKEVVLDLPIQRARVRAFAAAIAGFRLVSGDGAPDGVAPRTLGVHVGPVARLDARRLKIPVRAWLEPGTVALRDLPSQGYTARARIDLQVLALEGKPEEAVSTAAARGPLGTPLAVPLPAGPALPLLAGFEWRLDEAAGGIYVREIGVGLEADEAERSVRVEPVLGNRGLLAAPVTGTFAVALAFVALDRPAAAGGAVYRASGRVDRGALRGPLFQRR
jgi:hypothetical protein